MVVELGKILILPRLCKRINFGVELFGSAGEKGMWLLGLKFERLRLGVCGSS